MAHIHITGVAVMLEKNRLKHLIKANRHTFHEIDGFRANMLGLVLYRHRGLDANHFIHMVYVAHVAINQFADLGGRFAFPGHFVLSFGFDKFIIATAVWRR
jgi:hypothetical protein